VISAEINVVLILFQHQYKYLHTMVELVQELFHHSLEKLKYNLTMIIYHY